jgi:hypothetical protein
MLMPVKKIRVNVLHTLQPKKVANKYFEKDLRVPYKYINGKYICIDFFYVHSFSIKLEKSFINAYIFVRN